MRGRDWRLNWHKHYWRKIWEGWSTLLELKRLTLKGGFLSQINYIFDLLKATGILGSKPATYLLIGTNGWVKERGMVQLKKEDIRGWLEVDIPLTCQTTNSLCYYCEPIYAWSGQRTYASSPKNPIVLEVYTWEWNSSSTRENYQLKVIQMQIKVDP